MTTSPAHDDLLERLSVAVARDHRHRRRLRLASLAAVAVFVGAGATFAATQGPWWESAPPPVNPGVLDRQLAPSGGPLSADRAHARTVARIADAALVAAPAAGGAGYCLVPSLPGSPDLGFSCEGQATDEVRSYARPASHGSERWILYGRFTAPNAGLLDLSAAAGTPLRALLQHGGFFILDVPESRWPQLSNTAGPATLVDDAGKTLATVCIDWGPSPSADGAGRASYPSLLDSPPCRVPPQLNPQPVFAQARKLVEITLSGEIGLFKTGTRLALWKVPSSGGATCILEAPADRQPTQSTSNGETCAYGDGTPTGQPMNVMTAWTSGSPNALVRGLLDPASRIVRVVLRTAAGSTDLAVENHAFLGEAAARGEATVVAYDAAGNEVQSVPVTLGSG